MFSYVQSKINLRKTAVELGEDLTPMSIVGRHMFTHESGYESFMPDEIGASRRIVIGKHTGKHAVWDKLKELGIDVDKEKLLEIVSIVKERSESRKSAITDAELKKIANEVK